MTAAAALLVAAASMQATPTAWPGRVLPYRDLTGGSGYHAAIRSAVAAWNRLHLGVTFVQVARGSSVQIVYVRGSCLSSRAGAAPTGFARFGARVVVRTCPRVVRPILVAHELGRVLGLGNDDSRCSLMNSRGKSDGATYAVPARCSRWAPPAWLPGLIDPATAAHAREIYAAPASPGALTLDTETAPRLTWRQPARSGAFDTVVARDVGRCPTARDVAARTATVIYDRRAYRGLHWAVDRTLPAQHAAYCYRAFNLNPFGRATASTNAVTYVFDVPPTASFDVAGTPVAGTPARFADTSSDPDGSVVRWVWDFGDPAAAAQDHLDTTDPAAGRAPAHTYAQPGSYVVTLTVVDDGGRSASTSRTLEVAP